MKRLRKMAPGWGIGALLGLIGCAHFAGNRSSNLDLTLVSFGSLMGEIDECG